MAKEILLAEKIEVLVASNIFGKKIEGKPFLKDDVVYVTEIIDGQKVQLPLSAYSRDLNEAWKIVSEFGLWFGFQSKTNIKTMEVSMGNDLSEGEVVTFVFIVRDGIKQKTYGAEGTTLGRAICLSALRAKGIEVQDDVCEQ